MSNKQLIVFDFDWSMADQDTERWILEVLAPDLRRKVKTLKAQGGIEWTDLMAQTLREAHALGITREQIIHALQIMPFHPAMIRAVKKLKAEGNTTFLCLSSANTIFISTVLESKGLETLFEEIVTNPAEWDPSGCLILRRKVDPAGPQHNCTVGCTPNLCKGAFDDSSMLRQELEAFLKKQTVEYDRIIYVGDGSNDFCPILRLRSQDLALCRSYRGLQRCIDRRSEAKAMKCSIHYWAGAWEVEEAFNKL